MSPPAPPGRSFTIAALLGRPSPLPGPPQLWGSPPAPLLPPLCAPPGCGVTHGCGVTPGSGVTPGWTTRLGATGFLISKCCLPLLKAKPGKAKRVRTIFSSEQLARLEREFSRQQYLVGQERCLLASSLRLSEEQVKVWFQNRRIKWRKQSLEQQQARLAQMGLGTPQSSPESQSHHQEDKDCPGDSQENTSSGTAPAQPVTKSC